MPTGDFSPQLPAVATDAEGKFRATLLPGCKYWLRAEGGKFRLIQVAQDLAIQPGESKDLGRLTFDEQGKLVRSVSGN